MATSFTSAITALAPYVDNGVNSSDTTRIESRINEAQRRLIDQYNFLVRREEASSKIYTTVNTDGKTILVETERPVLVYSAGGVSVGTTKYLIFDNIDATKVMILCLWREENNELEIAASLEQKALGMLERDLMQTIEAERRVGYRYLESNYSYDQLGGLVGRLGLEAIPRYRIAPNRLRSYVRAAYRMAVDHHNYIVRREALDRPAITANTLSTDSTAMAISPEIVREIVLAQLNQDQP